MADPKAVRHRDIDEEKSLRQMKGLDGDAIEEDHLMAEKRPHEEIFEADAADDAAEKATQNTRAKDDVDVDRAA